MSPKRRGSWKIGRLYERGFIVLLAHTSRPYLYEFPDVADAWIWRGMSFVPIARYDDAGRAYERALEFSPSDLRSVIWWKKGQMSQNRGDFEAAIDCYSRAAELDPKEGEFWSLIGETLARRGGLAKAEQVLLSALKNDCRKSEHIYNVLAQISVSQGMYSEAKNFYETALKLNPNFMPAIARYKELEAFDQLGLYPQASLLSPDSTDDVDDRPLSFLCQYGVERHQTNPVFWINRGRALGSLWRYDEARAAFDKARGDKNLGQGAYFAWLYQGHMEEKRGDYLAAQSCYENAKTAEPRLYLPSFYLGSLLFRWGELERAEKVLRDTLELEGDKDETLFNLGGVLLAQERYLEAAQCYRAAIKIDPDYTLAKIRLLDVELALRWRRKNGLNY